MVPDDSLHHPRARRSPPGRRRGTARTCATSSITLGYDVDRPWRELPKKDRDWILFTDEQPTVPVYAGFDPGRGAAGAQAQGGAELHGHLHRARGATCCTPSPRPQSALMKKRVAQYMVERATARSCHGKRLRREALSVTFAGLDIAELSRAAAASASPRCFAPTPTAARRPGEAGSASIPRRPIVAQRIARGPVRPARACCSTSASATCRSSAARRRSRPASCSGCAWPRRCARTCSASSTCSTSRRPGCIPPTPRRCCAALDRLKASGNSLFVVEHELDVIRHADWIVDVGPGAGEQGGQVLYSGPPDGPGSGRGLADAPLPVRRSRAAARAPRDARRAGCASRASRATTCTTSTSPSRSACFTTVTGVSGSGKSSLVSQALVELVAAHLGHATPTRSDDEADALERAPLGADRRPHRRAAWSASSGWCASTRSRSAARRARTSPPTPACSTTCASCSPRRQGRARPALRRRPLLVQRRQGPLRDLRGRGLRHGRAALPAERLRALPDLPRRALQREDAGDHATAARTSPTCSA